MSNLLILGAGGQGKVVADIASMLDKWDSIAFLDDKEDLKEVIGFPVIGRLNDYLLNRDKFKYAFVAIGNNYLRLKWIEKLDEAGFIIPIIEHPKSMVSKLSKIKDGTIITMGAAVNVCAIIGKGCILNACCSVDHDCIINDGVHISPGAHIGGTVTIGSLAHIGIGSSITNNITIGGRSIVAGGAAVIDDVPDNVMVAGVPAKIKKSKLTEDE